MKEFVSKLLSNNVVEARNILDLKIKSLVEKKINQVKLRLTAEMYDDTLEEKLSSVGYGQSNFGSGKQRNKSTVTRSNIVRQGRSKLVKVRIRKGKLQRRKKFSAVKGYTIRGGKLTRMMPSERRNRRVGSKRSLFKRRAKLQLSVRRRKMSLRRRRAMGI